MCSTRYKASGMKKIKDLIILSVGGAVIFTGFETYRGGEKFYENYVMPCFRIFSAETAHKIAVKAAKYKLIPRPAYKDSPSLEVKVWGKKFSNPIGLAAGFDKGGEAVDGLLRMGFGFVEIGSVLPNPQPGNPLPRVFRLTEDKGVINRYGFNSEGKDAVYRRLKFREEEPNVSADGILGVNLGKNKHTSYPVDDYVKGIRTFGKIADYLVINVSSPNTPGLRALQGRKELSELIDKVVVEKVKLKSMRNPPLLVKIAPDLTEEEKADIAAVATRKNSGIDGLIVSNTTVTRPASLKSLNKDEIGGLSGEPLKELSSSTVRDMYRLTQGKLPIIGVGGVSSGQDAYDKIKAGASLIQIYTALIYKGPPVVVKIKRELDELLRRDGYSSVTEAIGKDHQIESKSSS